MPMREKVSMEEVDSSNLTIYSEYSSITMGETETTASYLSITLSGGASFLRARRFFISKASSKSSL